MSTLTIDPETSQRIGNAIQSDASPVGIDAKKTHVVIIHMLEQIGRRLDAMESRISDLESKR